MKLSVSCFGKLRIFGDFVEPVQRSGFRDDLRQWLYGSIGAGESLKSRDPGRATYRIVWPLGKEIQVAVLWASQDAVGRRFPFCLYTEFPRRHFPAGALHAVPLEAAPLWKGLQETALTEDRIGWRDLDAGSGVTAQDVQRAVKRARLRYDRDGSLADRFAETLRSWNGRELLSRLLTPAFWVLYPRLCWKLGELAAQIAGEDDPVVAFSLPASDALDSGFQAAFWLKVLESLLARPCPKLPALVLPAGEDTASGLWVLFRDFTPPDAQVLFGDLCSHAYIADLRRPESPSRRLEAFNAFIGRLQRAITEDLSGLGLSELPLREFREDCLTPIGPEATTTHWLR